jgi:hypothetical protein
VSLFSTGAEPVLRTSFQINVRVSYTQARVIFTRFWGQFSLPSVKSLRPKDNILPESDIQPGISLALEGSARWRKGRRAPPLEVYSWAVVDR